MAHVTPLGKMTLFYIPSHKLDLPGPASERAARAQIHQFLMQHYQAYTHMPSPVKGFWLSEKQAIVHDVLERFEVSFASEEEFQRLLDFLGELCRSLGEEAIYLTRGEESFLVGPVRS
ncbi:MAG TPA: hypothetical protein VFA18_20365 [Gemmataceae bacterium]|nr:hypothetical protein [Gemmataceae bacterium]